MLIVEVLKARPNNIGAKSGQALIMSACPDGRLRDGSKAIEAPAKTGKASQGLPAGLFGVLLF